MRQVFSIQNRVHSSGVPAWLCRSNKFEADDDDLYMFPTLHDSWKKRTSGFEDNRWIVEDRDFGLELGKRGLTWHYYCIIYNWA
jgi:hypothetical protein